MWCAVASCPSQNPFPKGSVSFMKTLRESRGMGTADLSVLPWSHSSFELEMQGPFKCAASGFTWIRVFKLLMNLILSGVGRHHWLSFLCPHPWDFSAPFRKPQDILLPNWAGINPSPLILISLLSITQHCRRFLNKLISTSSLFFINYGYFNKIWNIKFDHFNQTKLIYFSFLYVAALKIIIQGCAPSHSGNVLCHLFLRKKKTYFNNTWLWK